MTPKYVALYDDMSAELIDKPVSPKPDGVVITFAAFVAMQQQYINRSGLGKDAAWILN